MTTHYEQPAPYAVQLEAVEGCNLACSFCGINGIREKQGGPYKRMTLETAERIAVALNAEGWNPRIEFAMHGEPTMHDDLAALLRVFRSVNKAWQLMVTTNGAGLFKQPGPIANIKALFDAGLNVLAVDDYQYVQISTKLRAAINAEALGVPIHEYPSEADYSPHNRYTKATRFVVFIQDISLASTGTHSSLNNHAGAAAPPNESAQGKRCAKPFRELSFRWDGNVALCCNDWRGLYKCGNINDTALENIWNGPAMQAARRYLYAGERTFGPCKGCDARSHRVGLLPDKYGKVELAPPDADTAAEVEHATSGPSYTTPVQREWEKQAQ